MNIIDELMPEVKYLFEEGDGVHDWDHTLRVYNLSMHIGKLLHADLEILGIAALLHDIGRAEEEHQNHKVCHAKIGSIIAEGILLSHGVDSKKIKAIKYCILSHRYSSGEKPKTKEAQILYDADKLDNIGAIGIGRAFNYSGTYGARTHNPEVDSENVIMRSKDDTAFQYYNIKLKKIKDKLFTDEAHRIAESRDKYMKEFFLRLNSECRGEI